MHPDDVFIEAESFTSYGGWVMDQQAMDVMGSAYLMAHGLGVPVANARTTVTLKAGAYHVFVRTRDWVAPHGPGRFRVLVNGRPVERVFGAGGDGAWRWTAGGQLNVSEGEGTLELEDLTGFNARCDAIALTRSSETPPDDGDALARYRREALRLPAEPDEGGTFDFVVVGGGYAGVCAAIAAARLGLKVVLVQDRPVLGGNASSEVRVGPIGNMNHGPFPRNAEIVRELQSTPGATESSGGLRARPNDAHVEAVVRAEPNITLLLETHLVDVDTDAGKIIACTVRNLRTSRELRVRGTLFADCTGDATLGVLAGADWRMGRESARETNESLAPLVSDNLLLGCTNLWTARREDEPTAFPACPWALPITDESRDISTPKYPPKFGEMAFIGGWNWESGFGRDMIGEIESIRDHNLRAMFGMWDYLKNRAPDRADYANARLTWAAFIAGKRESRRLMGDHVLNEHDMTTPVLYDDGCVTATWYFDAHFPHPANTVHFPGAEFRSLAYDDPNFEQYRGDIRGTYTKLKPYPIPFRCLYSRNIANLFMAGRNISVTHVGLLPVRVMNTTGMMGTVVGRAAALCARMGVSPRALATERLDALKAMLADPR